MEKGIKYDKEKIRLDLISTCVLKGLAKILTYGCKKYEERNWENGLKFGRIYAAILRHLIAFWEGEDYDKESKELHIDHAMCNIHFLSHFIHNYEKYYKFDDRSKMD